MYLTWESFFGQGAFVQSLTPTEPLVQNLNHCVWAEYRVPAFIAKFYMYGEAIQVERDVMVWNNKRYNNNPVLCKGDSLIKKHRAWCVRCDGDVPLLTPNAGTASSTQSTAPPTPMS